MNFMFYLSSVLLGVGLAMDAFTVSIANGMSNQNTGFGTALRITAVYAFFQFTMPMLGWFLVHEAVNALSLFNRFVPWIALILLVHLGGRMIFEGLHGRSEANRVEGEPDGLEATLTSPTGLALWTLLLQGIATSIDALSIGFAITAYDVKMAFVCSTIIAAVTWGMCVTGIFIGKRVGKLFSAHATIVGGIIFVLIGIEVFAKGALL